MIEDPLARLMVATNGGKAPSDFNGWLSEYVCRLLASYSQFSEQYVWDELPMIRGWIYYNWAIENDPMNRFGGLKRISPGYVGMEADKLVAEAYKVWEK